MPFYCDYHMHSHNSFDAEFSVRAMAQAAVEAGLSEVCFTDHVDFEDPAWRDTPADLFAQRAEIEKEQPAFAVQLLRGAEVGLAPDASFAAEAWDYVRTAEPDFIIGSVHMVGTQNVYLPEYFATRERAEAYHAYVAAIAASARTLPQLSVLGHYDFVTKRAPYPARPISYQDAPEAFDAIFRWLAENGKGMEVNTSAWLDGPQWGLDVLTRFRELGGEFVTFGSDAHTPRRVGRRLAEARALAKAAGIRYTAAFRGLQPRFLPI